MKVTLISYTQDAVNLLLFTKQTRLNMTPGLLEEVRGWPDEMKFAELSYMANTIPSSWEFVDYIFLIEGVSRAFTHQFVRTRHGSYAQQSLRIVDAGDFDFVMPERLTAKAQHSSGLAYPGSARHVVLDVLERLRAAYKELRRLSVAPEDARAILPTNVSTNIVAKFNLRTMAELAASRTGGRTQGEYQDVMKAMTEAITDVHPWATQFLFPIGRNYFDDIEAFAEEEFGGDLARKGRLLRIVDKMRKERK
jgi:flavin-dependent thymidylate synthase